jgi:hemerythrin-like domain-containing protein
MLEMEQPDIAADMRYIHAIITRALNITTAGCISYGQNGYPEDRIREGFRNYMSSLVTVLHSHHHLEDELAFPFFGDKMPDLPVPQLAGDHQQISALLEEIKPNLAPATASPPDKNSLDRLADLWEKITNLWHPHIQIEQDNFTLEKITALIDQELHLKLSLEYGEYSRTHATPEPLVVPFLLFNLPPEQRHFISSKLPPFVTQQLVPVEWKPLWETMSPFLLA